MQNDKKKVDQAQNANTSKRTNRCDTALAERQLESVAMQSTRSVAGDSRRAARMPARARLSPDERKLERERERERALNNSMPRDSAIRKPSRHRALPNRYSAPLLFWPHSSLPCPLVNPRGSPITRSRHRRVSRDLAISPCAATWRPNSPNGESRRPRLISGPSPMINTGRR